MNVLILTPDAVGSTLLQRLITIYMQFYDYDRPVINLHELSNGLIKYYNTNFEQEILGKKDGEWGYHQTLEQIVDLLKGADHYKTSRLAHYHIRNRQDSIADQTSFYQYLNENFYIISCRRHNVFEHALSWCLSKLTKKLNVYNTEEKIDTFFDLYRNGVDVDPNSLVQTLNAYKEYIIWCNNHFNIASYFFYEEHLPCIENYILNLPIFPQTPQKITWKDNFGISFDNWNMYRYLCSDLGTLALTQPEKFSQLTYKSNEIDYSSEVKSNYDLVKKSSSQALIQLLPEKHQNFISQHSALCNASMNDIGTMIEHGIVVSPPPIKKQTLAEKKHMIQNFHSLLNVYNQWIEQNPELGNPLDHTTLDKFADIESNQWDPAKSSIAISVESEPD